MHVFNGAQQAPQPAGVVVDPDPPDGGERYRARVVISNPDQVTTALVLLVAQTEAVAATAFALANGETNLSALPRAGLRVMVGSKGTAEIDGGLLEHLRGDLVSPDKPGDLLRGRSIRGDDEQTARVLALLPDVERVDEVESRPRHPHRRVSLVCDRVGHELKALVIGKPRGTRVPGERLPLCRCGVQCEPEGRMPHVG
jgi:hypothetical protein